LINELSKVFSRLNIDTHDVLEAASTKWNFINFYPGLVGGHCIGVDPYYLAYRAQEVGCFPELILAGRSVNDGMATHVANQVSEALASFGDRGSNKILVLGLTFKENCPDIRNSKVFDLISDLQRLGFAVDICDPVLEEVGIYNTHGLSLTPFKEIIKGKYDAVVHAVAHDHFIDKLLDDLMPIFNAARVVFDVKSALPRSAVTHRL
jgi:UDP-N-acetyl-D-galactosamine dehydrogenase